MKKLLFILALFVTVTCNAQSDLLSVFGFTSDTVTNTGVVTLTSGRVARGENSTVVQVVVTKISGTVGGTLTLMGSLDGTNFKAINTVGTQTGITTVTAADASSNYHYYILGNPFLYYRVSWTGTGTMAASFTAKILTR
jgi:hypothetical protein